MYKWLVILSVIIVASIVGLTLLGYHSVRLWAKGAEGARLGEFAAVAEQVRLDVKHKLESFLEREQRRPYTDYLYYYVPENIAAQNKEIDEQQMVLLRSPLAANIENDLAYGNFQIESDWKISTPYYRGELISDGSREVQSQELRDYLNNIKSSVLPALRVEKESRYREEFEAKALTGGERLGGAAKDAVISAKGRSPASQSARVQTYQIETLQESPRPTQVVEQQRDIALFNVAQNTQAPAEKLSFRSMKKEQYKQRSVANDKNNDAANGHTVASVASGVAAEPASALRIAEELNKLEGMKPQGKLAATDVKAKSMEESKRLLQTARVREIIPDHFEELETDKVRVRIEPFVPLVVKGGDSRESVFGGQVFLLRHVQIEDSHFLQGFKLNEKRLLDEVKDSAQRFMRKGMRYELAKEQNPEAGYSAILDFGFGSFVLNIMETDPAWISSQIGRIRVWYFSIVAVVVIAATGGLVSLWRNVREQVKLTQKKDDFISAVSHELRTPLTSIRMYSEMLDKDWVKSQDKQREYYKSMRQESERLSRLIENVLDFSRIQKGRKSYNFRAGRIDKCVEGVVEMMRPYAAQNGFKIILECNVVGETSFDGDTVTQIVVNLIDNAVKYARDAEDKTIIVRTQNQGRFVVIEVEDHGPGIPHHQRKKVFEEFYRTEAENTRQTQGMGLGLALVRRFAEAHNGFVEILSARPKGAVLRVCLPAGR
ncbi:MAG: HAMP domain-containing histidine kinase [Sedimentisphaerales bacterium]|nr:HAMP domain-containing histidine kinase [Sedimentisphaerales bacterium]